MATRLADMPLAFRAPPELRLELRKTPQGPRRLRERWRACGSFAAFGSGYTKRMLALASRAPL
ncbi:uncharacterized protein PST29_2787 [Pseudomonas sp. St29]|nr:uncharacterized protein PST29_2787 [Pseudomonas sp. St29]